MRRIALIVDDSPINRDILATYLKDEGFDTSLAANGVEGYNKFKEIKPSITFLDIVMPKTTGLELLKRIKKEYKDACIVMVSSYISKQTLKDSKEARADWFLMKPFTRDKVVEIINKLVS